MEVYQSEDKFVIGLCGGEFYSLLSPPKAFISNKKPVPSRCWTIPSIIDKTFVKGQEWAVETELREYICDDKKVFILLFDYFRAEPGYCSGKAEFFVSEEYANEKIASFRSISTISEYSWDATVPTWKEL
jgi:hypothetical protein